MEKIKLAGKEYELPEVTFKTMRDLGKAGFRISNAAEEDNIFDTLAILVSYITNTTIEDACNILDEEISCLEDFTEISTKLSNWIYKSDFFQKLQAKKEQKK